MRLLPFSSSTRLTLAIVFCLGDLAAMGLFAAQRFQTAPQAAGRRTFLPDGGVGTERLTSPPSHRVVSFEALARKARSAWPGMIALFNREAPPAMWGGPGPFTASDATVLAGFPLVHTAFYLDPDKRLVMLTKTRGNGMMAFNTDLREFRPQTLYPNFLIQNARLHHDDAARRQALDHQHVREELIARFSDALTFGMASRPLQPFTYVAPVQRYDFDHLIFVRSDSQGHFIGYEFDDRAFVTSPQAAHLLQRCGLAGKAIWTTLVPPFESPSYGIASPFPVPANFPALRLDPDPTQLLLEDSWQDLWSYAGLGLLASLLVLGISGAIRSMKALLDERAIALSQSHFVAGVSHEMRTPLTSIKMYAELMSQGIVTEPERQQQYFRTTIQECDRLSRLIENVLDFAKISGHHRPYRFEPTDVAALAAEAASLLEGPAQRAGVAIQLADHGPVRAILDREAVLLILVNLLGNAIKYGATGGQVRMAAEAWGPVIALTVSDDGPGIPLAEQRKIFRPFYRVASEATAATAGSGLGLALVSEHVKAHHGSVDLKSAEGKGATFIVTLPTTPPLATPSRRGRFAPSRFVQRLFALGSRKGLSG